MLELFATLILLHSPDQHEIVLNPSSITSMRSPYHHQKNEHFTEDAHCLINTNDGKFVTVTETCKQVEELIRAKEK